MACVVSVDVGTSEVRAAVIDKCGKIMRICKEPIEMWHPKPDFYLQSSDNIWSACSKVVKSVVSQSKPSDIKAIGFDATCSLVVLDAKGRPLPVYPHGDPEQNVIVWLDHRAKVEAELIDKTKHAALDVTGGKIWCELSMAKLLWLKTHMRQSCWNKAAYFMLLPDFMTWKATQCDSRSVSTSSSMCGFKSSPKDGNRWDQEFIDLIGMSDLSENNWGRIGSRMLKPGQKCGEVTETVADKLGLTTGVAVASALVDAHAGALGLIGHNENHHGEDFSAKLAIICGSSTCHLTISNVELYIPGLWGPYYEAVIPKKWLIYGGQSATGKLIDHIIDTHPATANIRKAKQLSSNISIQEYLNILLINMATDTPLVDKLTESIHVYPDFHGNRSPLSDETFKGMISGLSLSSDEKDLALLYLATLQALVYQTKQIMEIMEKAGHPRFRFILISGGLSRNSLFLQSHANAIGIPVLWPVQQEAVLVGTAMSAVCAAGFHPTLMETIRNMAGPVTRIQPNSDMFAYHQKKYQVFMEMLNHQKVYQNIMKKRE